MSFAKELWHGNKSLAFTFWIMFLIMGYIIQSVILMIGVGMLILSMNIIYLKYGLILALPFYYFLSVSVWRSSANYIAEGNGQSDGFMIWGYLSRTYVLLTWILFLSVILGFTVIV